MLAMLDSGDIILLSIAGACFLVLLGIAIIGPAYGIGPFVK